MAFIFTRCRHASALLFTEFVLMSATGTGSLVAVLNDPQDTDSLSLLQRRVETLPAKRSAQATSDLPAHMAELVAEFAALERRAEEGGPLTEREVNAAAAALRFDVDSLQQLHSATSATPGHTQLMLGGSAVSRLAPEDAPPLPEDGASVPPPPSARAIPQPGQILLGEAGDGPLVGSEPASLDSVSKEAENHQARGGTLQRLEVNKTVVEDSEKEEWPWQRRQGTPSKAGGAKNTEDASELKSNISRSSNKVATKHDHEERGKRTSDKDRDQSEDQKKMGSVSAKSASKKHVADNKESIAQNKHAEDGSANSSTAKIDAQHKGAAEHKTSASEVSNAKVRKGNTAEVSRSTSADKTKSERKGAGQGDTKTRASVKTDGIEASTIKKANTEEVSTQKTNVTRTSDGEGIAGSEKVEAKQDTLAEAEKAREQAETARSKADEKARIAELKAKEAERVRAEVEAKSEKRASSSVSSDKSHTAAEHHVAHAQSNRKMPGGTTDDGEVQMDAEENASERARPESRTIHASDATIDKEASGDNASSRKLGDSEEYIARLKLEAQAIAEKLRNMAKEDEQNGEAFDKSQAAAELLRQAAEITSELRRTAQEVNRSHTHTASQAKPKHNPLCTPGRALDFTKAGVAASNLGGMGPDEGYPWLVFTGVTSLNGTQVDLEVVANSSYAPRDVSHNGLHGPFGVINLQVGSGVELVFTFVNHSTGEPVLLEPFYFTFFDVDQGMAHGSEEKVTVYGFDDFVLSDNSEIEHTLVDYSVGSAATFSSSMRGGKVDNPVFPASMSHLQRERSVTVEFRHSSSFRVTLEALDFSDLDGGRNFIFSGASQLTCPRDETCVDFACPAGYHVKTMAEFLLCDAGRCGDADLDTCCFPSSRRAKEEAANRTAASHAAAAE